MSDTEYPPFTIKTKNGCFETSYGKANRLDRRKHTVLLARAVTEPVVRSTVTNHLPNDISDVVYSYLYDTVVAKEVKTKSEGATLKTIFEASSKMNMSSPCVRYIRNQRREMFYYLIMEHYRGKTLKRCVDEGISEQQRISVIEAMIRAYSNLHLLGYAHNKISPNHILVSWSGSGTNIPVARVKLCGFSHSVSPCFPHFKQAVLFDVTQLKDYLAPYALGLEKKKPIPYPSLRSKLTRMHEIASRN